MVTIYQTHLTQAYTRIAPYGLAHTKESIPDNINKNVL